MRASLGRHGTAICTAIVVLSANSMSAFGSIDPTRPHDSAFRFVIVNTQVSESPVNLYQSLPLIPGDDKIVMLNIVQPSPDSYRTWFLGSAILNLVLLAFAVARIKSVKKAKIMVPDTRLSIFTAKASTTPRMIPASHAPSLHRDLFSNHTPATSPIDCLESADLDKVHQMGRRLSDFLASEPGSHEPFKVIDSSYNIRRNVESERELGDLLEQCNNYKRHINHAKTERSRGALGTADMSYKLQEEKFQRELSEAQRRLARLLSELLVEMH